MKYRLKERLRFEVEEGESSNDQYRTVKIKFEDGQAIVLHAHKHMVLSQVLNVLFEPFKLIVEEV